MKPILKKSVAVVVLAAGMVVAIATTPQAGSAFQQTARPYARRALAHQWLVNHLSLTDAQKAQAKSAYQAAWQNAKPLMEQLRQNREAMTAAVKANDATQIRQLAAIQGALTCGVCYATTQLEVSRFISSIHPNYARTNRDPAAPPPSPPTTLAPGAARAPRPVPPPPTSIVWIKEA